MPDLWVILVDYEGLEDTRKCLHSLQQAEERHSARVVVVDNASRRNVAEELTSHFPDVDFVRSEINGGWSGGNNQGMRHALARGARLMVLLNNDTTVDPQFLVRIRCAANSHPDFGIFGPVIRFMEPPHEVQTDGVRFNRNNAPGFFQRHPVPLRTTEPPTMERVDIVNGCCLVVRSEVVERIGFVDDDFFLIHEESDFCLRAGDHRFSCGVLAESLVYHKGSSSFVREGKRHQRYYDARNLLRLILKRPHHRKNRPKLVGFLLALRYCYHRWCHEQELGHDDAARAVLEGVHDAFTCIRGVWTRSPRLGLPLLERLVKIFARVISGGKR